MAYLRFLTDSDYLTLLTAEHVKQLTRDIPERIVQAEQRAEMNMLEYLDQYYEIEKVLAVGKSIRNYSQFICYPVQAYINKDGHIYKTMNRINACKKPETAVYWEHIVDFINPCEIDHVHKYSQLHTYVRGDIVKFGTEYWRCLVAHGYDMNEIHIPGILAWSEVESTPWEPNLMWEKYQVCSYDGAFYMYMSDSPEGGVIAPDENDDWGMIGEYSEDFQYEYGEDSHDYVTCGNKVYKAMLNPNADTLEVGVNIVADDPRNVNIVQHMSRIAVYYLHQLISPTNISETRKWAYDESMQWLYNASKFKINPQLPRKHEHDTGTAKVDWALATYQKSYDPYENAWLI